MDTLRIFGRGEAETDSIRETSQDFRQRTMEVLRLAFLSSGVLEFFTSLSIALVAVYFGFSYLGELNFGSYGAAVTLSSGFLALILAPEFFQPLRDLGTFYHAKAQAVGAADSLKTFLEAPLAHPEQGDTGYQRAGFVKRAGSVYHLAGRQNARRPAQFHAPCRATCGAGRAKWFREKLVA